MFKIYNNTLIDLFSKTNLNYELISFYSKWKKRYLRAVKSSVPLKEYLYYAFDQPTSNNAATVSEAMGYGLVIFALMSKFDPTAKSHFSYLYNYIKSYPSIYNNNLMAWQQIMTSNGDIINAEADTSSATDGDMEISYGLILAHKIWGEYDEIDYKGESIKRIKALMESCVNQEDYFLTLGDWVKGIEKNNFKFVTRCSDFLVYEIKEFIKYDIENSSEWKQVINKIESIINEQMENLSKYNGLMPDFLVKDDFGFSPPNGKILESNHDGDYYYNSCRIPWRYSMDMILNNVPVTNQLRILNSWIKNTTFLNPNNIKSGYYIVNDYPGKPFGFYNDLSFIAPFLVSSIIEQENTDWTISLWKTIMNKPITQCTFYENTLKLLAMIAITGNWQN